MAAHPDTSAFELGRQARHRFGLGQFEAACALLSTLADQVPDNPYVRMDLATVLQQSGRLRDSTQHLLEAARLPALDSAFAVHLARGLFHGGEALAARACLDPIERMPHLPATLLAEMAHLHWTMLDVPAARVAIDRAVAAGAQSANELHLQAMLMQFAGDLEQAEAVLRRCLQRWPGFGSAALALANLRRQTPVSQLLDVLRQQLQRLPTHGDAASIANRAAFEAALFKTLDDLGEADAAWQALVRCNALMCQVVRYDAAAETALVDALLQVGTALAQRPLPEMTSPDEPQPIFIVGMPRSGTTLLDRMLSSHSRVASAGEITDFMRQLRYVTDVPPQGVQGNRIALERSVRADLAELGRRYLAQTQWRAEGRAYYLDKLPGNLRLVAHIRHALPHARILHITRDPMDACFSNLATMFGNSSPHSYDQATLAHHYGQHARLVRHWREVMPGAMLEVSYGALVQQPETTLRAVLDHCGLAEEDACFHPERNTAPVATPSGMQVRERIHTRGLERWRRYAPHLDILQRAVAAADE